MTSGKLSQDKPIAMSELDSNFKTEIAGESGGENVKLCFACGTCTVVCPVFAVKESYNPRKLIRMMVLGFKEEVLSADLIWFCSGCYSCFELCPRDVKITDLMGAVRNIAVREGHIPAAHKASIDLTEKFGRLTEVSDFENTIRSKKDMPELPLTVPEIKDLLKRTGIRDIVKGGDPDE